VQHLIADNFRKVEKKEAKGRKKEQKQLITGGLVKALKIENQFS
jgi:hypothetical protein